MPFFQPGKSYVWLFLVYLVFFIVGGVLSQRFYGNPSLAILLMPASIALILAWEIRSGIALDSWWRASYPKGGRRYKALLIWHATVLALLSAFSAVFIFIAGS